MKANPLRKQKLNFNYFRFKDLEIKLNYKHIRKYKAWGIFPIPFHTNKLLTNEKIQVAPCHSQKLRAVLHAVICESMNISNLRPDD